MKTFIILIICIVGVFAQSKPLGMGDKVDDYGQAASWTGNLANSNLTWKGPVYQTPTVCIQSTSLQNYYTFTYSFATSGTRQIGVLTDTTLFATLGVYVYTTFNPATPCSGIVRPLVNGNNAEDSGIMKVNDPFYFQANTVYTFVVTSVGNSNNDPMSGNGQFAFSIFGSTSFGTTVNQPSWTPAAAIGSGCVNNSAINSTQLLATWTFTNPNAGFYDIIVMFENTGTDANVINSNRVTFAIYDGQLTSTQLSANNCPNPGTTGINKIDISAYEADLETTLVYYSLAANHQYTIAVSNNNPGNFAIQILPSRVATANAVLFNQPNRATPCAANATAVGAGFVGPVNWNAAYNRYFMDTYATPYYHTIRAFNEEAFAYSGTIPQSIAANIAACPTGTTLLAAANIGGNETLTGTPTISSPMILQTTASSPYSLIISTLNGAALPALPSGATAWGAQIFILAGNSLDPGATVTTTTGATATAGTTTSGSTGNTTSTTGTSTTGSSTTNPTGTGSTTNPTSTTTNTPTNTPTTSTSTAHTSTTSNASALSLSALLLVAAFLALL